MNRLKLSIQNKIRAGAFFMLLPFVAITFSACGNDDTQSDMPKTETWTTIGNDVRPQWTSPVYGNYETTMSVQVTPEDTLRKYFSSGDLVAAFIQNETRAVATPDSTLGVTYFPLVIAGTGESLDITLKYYCDKLHRIFTVENWKTFNANISPTDDKGVPYVIGFTSSFK